MDYIVKIIGIPVAQNQQEFVLSKFTISQIFKFTKFTKRLIVGYDDDNMPIYNEQIQRFVESSRVEKIADFLMYDPEATFPTNIVLHIPIQAIDYQKEIIDKDTKHRFFEICLNEVVFEQVKKERNIADSGDIYINIIDGQHRIRGIEIAIERLQGEISRISTTIRGNPQSEQLKHQLKKFEQRLRDLLNIELVVSFFIDKTLEYQAMIFSTINRTQKRVSESLVSSLFGLTTEDTPQKTALQVVLSLNSIEVSPFFNRIKLYGGSYDRGQSPPLSQATMVKSIVDRICENSRQAELDRYKPRKDLSKRSPGSNKNLIFRRYYANDNDSKISDIYYYFFSAVRETFQRPNGQGSYWDLAEPSNPTNILHTTAGYFSLLQILEEILEKINEDDKFKTDKYIELLSKAKDIAFDDQKRYPFTTKTRRVFYLDLSLAIWPPESSNDTRLLTLQELLKEKE